MCFSSVKDKREFHKVALISVRAFIYFEMYVVL